MPHKKPPKDKQFKKGQSGNPNGRPRGKSISSYLKEFGEADLVEYEVRVTENGKVKKLAGKIESPGQNTNAALAAILLRKALNGDLQAWKEIVDRTEGRAKNITELTGKDGEPLQQTTNIIIPDNGRD